MVFRIEDSTGRAGHRLRETVQTLGIPACVVDADGTITEVNHAWRSGLAGAQRWWDTVHPQDRDVARAALGDAGAGPAECDCRLLTPTGETRWYRLSRHPDPAGEPAGRHWLCTGVDITGLQCAHQNAAKLVDLDLAMLDASADCIKLIAVDGSLQQVNGAGRRALGIPEDSALGMQWLPLLPAEVHADGERALATARAGSPAAFAGRSEHDGTIRLWDNALTPVRGAGGDVIAIVCVSREVTRERAVLDALEQSRDRLAMAAHVGGLGIWDYDIAADELHCDETWYRVMRRDPAHPVLSVADLRPLFHPDDADRAMVIQETAAELVAGSRDYAIEYRIITPAHEVRWVRSAASLVKDATGAAVRAIGFVVDITDARREELALRTANRELEAAATVLEQENRLDRSAEEPAPRPASGSSRMTRALDAAA